jgi:hypothetical protein
MAKTKIETNKIKIVKGQRWLWEGKTGRKYIAEILANVKSTKYISYTTKMIPYQYQYAKLVQVISGSKPTGYDYRDKYKLKSNLQLTGEIVQKSSSGTWTYLKGQDVPKKVRISAVKKMMAAPKKKAKKRRTYRRW